MARNIFTRLTKPIPYTDEIEDFYFSELIEKLLIADKLIIDSSRLNEVSYLINNIGLGTTISLLDSGAIELHNDLIKISSMNKPELIQQKKVELRLMGLEPEHHLVKCLTKLRKDTGLNRRKFSALERFLIPVISRYEDEIQVEFYSQFHNDIMNKTLAVKSSISQRLFQSKGIVIDPNEIVFHLDHTFRDFNEYKYETNLSYLANLSEEDQHEVIVRSLLGFDSLNQRLLAMMNYDSIIGFNVSNSEILDKKLEYIFNTTKIDQTFDNLRAVLEFKRLPDLSNVKPDEIDLSRVLELRGAKEIVEFRDFLENLSDQKELDEILTSYTTKVGNILNSVSGKTSKLLMFAGVETIVPSAGFALGIVDEFILGKVFKENKAVSFIDNKIQTIYQDG